MTDKEGDWAGLCEISSSFLVSGVQSSAKSLVGAIVEMTLATLWLLLKGHNFTSLISVFGGKAPNNGGIWSKWPAQIF